MDYKYFRTVLVSQLNAVIRQKINPLELFMKPKNPIWMNFKMQKWFEKNLNKNMRVFEYGSGNSSKYIASKVKEHICVEDNKYWYNFNKKSSPKNMKIILAKDKVDYVNSICNKGLFDIIIIDGKYRKECVDISFKYVKKNGFIVFDNLEQLNYKDIFGSLNGKKVILKGLMFEQGGYCETGIYQK